MGNVVPYTEFASQYVYPHGVNGWFPPRYVRDTIMRYAVAYMHDGQNVFDSKISFVGVDWGVGGTTTRLTQEDTTQEAIIVDIWNPSKRTRECTAKETFTQIPSPERRLGFSGEHGEHLSDTYLEFIVEELKPLTDLTYRTLPDRDYTFVIGSRVGGLISEYALCEYQDVFGDAGRVSTYWSEGGGIMIAYVRQSLPDSLRCASDCSTEALDTLYEQHQMRVDALMREAGHTDDENWLAKAFPGDEHCEKKPGRTESVFL